MHRLLELVAPFLRWLPEVGRDTLGADLLAGITGALVVLPQGVAFAVIAGMPPEYGLYCAMVPTVVAALYGSSRVLLSGPAVPVSVVLFSALGAFAEPGTADYVRYALTLTFMVGVMQLGLGLARMGTVVNFISHSVVVGFTGGAAFIIAASQIRGLVGLDIPRDLAFHEVLAFVIVNVGDVHPYTMFVGVVTVVAGIVSRRVAPRFPYMLTAMLVGAATAWFANHNFYIGHHVPGLEPMSAVPASLPPLSSPDWSFQTMRELAPAAMALTLFALAQAVSVARALATRTGELVDGNREFVGQGLSNIVGSFFSAYVSTGSINRSGANLEAGARTPVAALVAGVSLMVMVPFVGPALGLLPKAALAGVLLLVASGLVDTRQMRVISRASQADSVVMWTTFFCALLLDLDFAILLGVLLSLGNYLYRASRPTIRVRVPDPTRPRRRFTTDPNLPECPQLAIVRIDGPLFFGAVNYVTERLRVLAKRNPGQKHLLVLSRSITSVDVAGAEMLRKEAVARREAGGGLYFHQLPDSARALLARARYLDAIGEENLYDTKGEAIGGIFDRLDRGICVRCEKRIFLECQGVPKVELDVEAVEEEEVGVGPVPAG
ncbi:MAG: STAS domain-containing protein [Ectothiorhodospiraceae bacterium]|nr:STAS domain-containing protein [Ectothiorhodospiraceae bacterium]